MKTVLKLAGMFIVSGLFKCIGDSIMDSCVEKFKDEYSDKIPLLKAFSEPEEDADEN